MHIEVTLVGLASLAGPVWGAAVLSDDSKFTVVSVGVRTIDQSNSFRLSSQLREQAVAQLWSQLSLSERSTVTHVVADGLVAFASPVRVTMSSTPPPLALQRATVERDRLMETYQARFPDWGFADHKGGDTPEHRHHILQRKAGTPVHRRSFAPLSRFARDSQAQRDQGRARKS